MALENDMMERWYKAEGNRLSRIVIKNCLEPLKTRHSECSGKFAVARKFDDGTVTRCPFCRKPKDYIRKSALYGGYFE